MNDKKPSTVFDTLNLPNTITVTRILLVPLFVIYLQKHLFLLALIVFVIAGLSDGLDGFLARYLDQRTALGAHLDPIADKLLLATGFITLSVLKLIPDWLAVIVISRDVLILTGLAICIMVHIKIEINPTIVSKFTTVCQLFTIFLVLLNQVLSTPLTPIYFSVLYAVTAGLTIISGLYYVYIGLNLQTENANNHSSGN